MKTCSFRGAQPRSRHENLFCVNEPSSPYCFSPCNHCSLCIPRYNLSCRERLGPMIQFGQTNGYTFVNGYKTLLNCPVNCETNNLIYVLTCPCGQYEYIGETSQRLIDRLRCNYDFSYFLTLYIYENIPILQDHRQQFNRIFHEFLLGEQNIQKTQSQEKDKQ